MFARQVMQLLTFSVVLGLTLSASAQGDKKKPFTDEDFVKKAASDGMHEVELGKIAQMNASSADVKQFGARMVADHSKANAQLMQVAPQAGISVPTAMMPKDQKEVDKFRTMRGDEFDKEYMNHMVKDHTTAVSLFKKASTEAKHPGLKNFAAQTLPVIQTHLQEAQRIQQAVGARSK